MDKESYHIQDFFNCCWNCNKSFRECGMFLKEGDLPEVIPLGICREYKRRIKEE